MKVLIWRVLDGSKGLVVRFKCIVILEIVGWGMAFKCLGSSHYLAFGGVDFSTNCFLDGFSTFRFLLQVGCKMGCKFCATGSMGFKNNLSSGEIVEQLVHASCLAQIRNVVFMVILFFCFL